MNRTNALKTAFALLLGALALLALPAIAAAKDGNHDRIPDRWEKRHNLSLDVNQAGRDQDRDHLRNRAEFLTGDNPRDNDSDDDGVVDGEENAGTIDSFDPATGRLVIALFGEEKISGQVTEQTEIKCEDEHAATASHAGEEEPGDDRGDHGEEPADDHGGDNPGPGGGDDNGAGASCTSADLVVGAVVQQAELELEHGVATFDEVELAG
jgi:hypothetical protein